MQEMTNDRAVLASAGLPQAEIDSVLVRVNWRKERIAAGDEKLMELLKAVMAASEAIREPVSRILVLPSAEAIAASIALKESTAFQIYQSAWQALDAYEISLAQAG